VAKTTRTISLRSRGSRFFHDAGSWYREIHGDAFERGGTDTALGLVLVRAIPVELAVPIARSRVEVPGKTAWLKFLIKVEDDENPLDWLRGAPNIALLDETEAKRVPTDAVRVATALLSIQMNAIQQYF